MGDLFSACRERVTAREAAERYGLQVTRHGKALCPWHEDRNPSLSFNRKTGRCKCFVCQGGGTSIDITAALLHVSALDAARTLNRDFALGVEAVPPTIREIEAAKAASLARQRERAELTSSIQTANDVYSTAWRLLRDDADWMTEKQRLDVEEALAWAADRLCNLGCEYLVF